MYNRCMPKHAKGVGFHCSFSRFASSFRRRAAVTSSSWSRSRSGAIDAISIAAIAFCPSAASIRSLRCATS